MFKEMSKDGLYRKSVRHNIYSLPVQNKSSSDSESYGTKVCHVNESIPSQCLIDFSTYTASILALWLGFSFVTIWEGLKKLSWNIILSMKLPRIFYILLLLGCFIHLYQVLNGFFQYEVSSIVSVGNPVKVFLPSVSLVFHLSTIANDSRGRFIYHSIKSEDIPSMTNISQIDKVQILNYNRANFDVYNFSIFANITNTYIFWNAKIVTINFHQLNREKHVDDYLPIRLLPLIHILRYRRSGNNVKLFRLREILLHEQKPDNFNHMVEFYPHYQIISGDIIKASLLKYPYQTKFMDYIDPYSDSNSLLNCKLKGHISKYGKIPFNIAVPLSSFNHSRMHRDPEIYNSCLKQYEKKLYCESTVYDTKISYKSRLQGGDILIRPPTQETKCIFLPKTSLLDLSILIADVFGLWLGISLGIILSIIKSYTYCINFDDFLIET